MLEVGGPVHNQGDRFAALLGSGIEEKALAIGSRIVQGAVGDQSWKEGLRSAGLKSFRTDSNWDRGKHVIGGHEIDLFAVASPAPRDGYVGGNLPLAGRAAEAHYIDL